MSNDEIVSRTRLLDNEIKVRENTIERKVLDTFTHIMNLKILCLRIRHSPNAIFFAVLDNTYPF